MILFGLTWLFGFLTIDNDIVAFQYLFCIASSIQGLYVFVFYGLRNKKIRLYWTALLRGKSPQFIQRSSTKQLQAIKSNRKGSGPDTIACNTETLNNDTLSTVSNGKVSKPNKEQKAPANIYVVP